MRLPLTRLRLAGFGLPGHAPALHKQPGCCPFLGISSLWVVVLLC